MTIEKDIGFWISEDLSSTTHVQKAKGKAMAEIPRICPTLIRRRSASSIIRGLGRISTTGWRLARQGHRQKQNLEAVQSKATALVHGLKSRNSEDRRKLLGLMTLQQRRERRDLIEVYKILNRLTRIDPAAFWEVRMARNRARLVKELATNGKKQRKNFFSYRVVQKWNLLPGDLKTAPSQNYFKNRLDRLMDI